MKPVEFPQATATLAKNQPQYRPLYVAITADGTVVSCWAFTWRERLAILFGRPLWLMQLTFGRSLQPQLPSLDSPFTVKVEA